MNIDFTKYFRSTVDDNETERLEEALRQKREEALLMSRDTLYRRCGVPAKYAEASLDDFDAPGRTRMSALGPDGKEALCLPAVRAFIDEVSSGRGRFLWLCGKHGTGKTALACAALREASRRGVGVSYINMVTLMEMYENRLSAAETTRMAVSAQLAVFDEVGCYPRASDEKFRVENLARRLYENNRSAIFITPLGRKQIFPFVENSRDLFCRIGKSLEFVGESHRGKDNELYAT